jgi:nicotinamide mononucleotide transporter
MEHGIWQQFIQGLLDTKWYEFIAVLAGIASVWFSRKENILVYPVGLINTVTFIFISIHGNLYGEASVNLYYTIMSIYGWKLWAKRDEQQQHAVQISFSTAREWIQQLAFFGISYGIIFGALTWMKQAFAPEAIPWADALASASAYTGMWLMARKKVESWYWWIITNLASIPLYFIKGYVFTSFQFIVLLIMAVAGLYSWRSKALNR